MQLSGAVGFQPTAKPLANLKAYFMNLTLEQNMDNFRNPWFSEYIVQENSCHLDNGKWPTTLGLLKVQAIRLHSTR